MAANWSRQFESITAECRVILAVILSARPNCEGDAHTCHGGTQTVLVVCWEAGSKSQLEGTCCQDLSGSCRTINPRQRHFRPILEVEDDMAGDSAPKAIGS